MKESLPALLERRGNLVLLVLVVLGGAYWLGSMGVFGSAPTQETKIPAQTGPIWDKDPTLELLQIQRELEHERSCWMAQAFEGRTLSEREQTIVGLEQYRGLCRSLEVAGPKIESLLSRARRAAAVPAKMYVFSVVVDDPKNQTLETALVEMGVGPFGTMDSCEEVERIAHGAGVPTRRCTLKAPEDVFSIPLR